MAVYKASNSGLLTRREYTSFLAGNDPFIPFEPSGAYDSIATTTVGSGGSSSITFSSIPATYTHLQIRGIANKASGSDNTVIQLNGDTAANYATHYLYGDGATASAGAATSNTFVYVDVLTVSATSFSASITDILDYANTSKYKTTRSLAGQDLNGSGTIWLASGLWMSSNAVTSIVLKPTAGNFSQYTQFALYGIKGA